MQYEAYPCSSNFQPPLAAAKYCNFCNFTAELITRSFYPHGVESFRSQLFPFAAAIYRNIRPNIRGFHNFHYCEVTFTQPFAVNVLLRNMKARSAMAPSPIGCLGQDCFPCLFWVIVAHPGHPSLCILVVAAMAPLHAYVGSAVESVARISRSPAFDMRPGLSCSPD
jgi:hypothetical protein